MNTYLFFRWSTLLGLILGGCIVIAGLIRFKKLTTDQRILVTLVSAAALTELTARIFWSYRMNNNFLYHFYTIAEFSLLGVLYTKHLAGLIRPVFTKLLIAIFVCFSLINTAFFQSLKEFNSNVTYVESLLLIALAIIYFYKLLRDLEHRKLEREPMFWINMAVLSYFSGAFILFKETNDLISLPQAQMYALLGTHGLFNIVHYILYGVAVWVSPVKIINTAL